MRLSLFRRDHGASRLAAALVVLGGGCLLALLATPVVGMSSAVVSAGPGVGTWLLTGALLAGIAGESSPRLRQRLLTSPGRRRS
ncbi:hypothetical protein CLV92_106227 [Kineococcus xinjiangensis]|uniref:Uncharacterized protein n=1 Tax=Kineococcus xinjiangensis TaxID=512762 RepID=A0A2S6IMD4_9ACTN|nr:hypothetical protein [Kineococcus xinjiangensis]PPK95404.1 hypothetical protein CLV92_106227 [Kineococcus xinjiangensis]